MSLKSLRRGRPEVDSEEIRARVKRPTLDALDAWAADQNIAAPRRPEAIRRALADHLRAKGYLRAPGDDPEGATDDVASAVGEDHA